MQYLWTIQTVPPLRGWYRFVQDGTGWLTTYRFYFAVKFFIKNIKLILKYVSLGKILIFPLVSCRKELGLKDTKEQHLFEFLKNITAFHLGCCKDRRIHV